MAVDLSLFGRLHARIAVSERWRDQPEGAHVDAHPVQDRPCPGRERSAFARVACFGAHTAFPASQSAPIVGVDLFEIAPLSFATVRTYLGQSLLFSIDVE